MNDKEHNQRLLRAALVSFLVLTAWTFLFPPKKPVKKRPAATSTEQAAETTKTSSPSVAAIQVATSSPTAVAMPVVKPELFHFAGQVKPSKDEDAIPFELSLTNVGGGIDRFILPGFKERTKDNTPSEEPISLAESVQAEADLSSQMAGVEFGEGTTFSVPLRPVYEVVSSGETKNGKSQVQYRYRTPEGVVVEREYRLDPESFELELAVTIKNNSPQPQRHALRLVTAQRLTPVMEAGGMLFMPPADQLNAACYTDEKVERDLHKELLDEPKSFSDGVKWVGTDRQYFLASVILRDDVEAKCRLEAKGKLARATLQLPETTLRPGEEKRHKFTAYIGVKKPGLLTRVDSQLEAAIDYTILGLNLAPVCQLLLWILAMIHGLSGSWGVAILGLTVLVKLALFPLNQRSGKSMRAMSALKPQIDELKEKYPEDKQRQSEEMMKLYRDNNVNPASGCVPMLLPWGAGISLSGSSVNVC